MVSHNDGEDPQDAAAAWLKANPHGAHIVNVASYAGFLTLPWASSYNASKAGVIGLTVPLARDLATWGIRVMTICPGTMDTPLLAGLPEPARQGLAAAIPFPSRLGQPSEFGALAAHIVENNYINGEVFRLDGALRMAPK